MGEFNTPVEENTDYDFSRTRVVPNVPFDSASSKENRTEGFCPANLIAKGTNNSDLNEKDIQTTRVNPDVAFDSKPNKDEGEIDRLGNTTNIQDAFTFAQCWDLLL